MRPPESFSTAAAKFADHLSGISWIVGVEIFIKYDFCCACAVLDGAANDSTRAPAAAIAAARNSHSIERMTSSQPGFPKPGIHAARNCGHMVISVSVRP